MRLLILTILTTQLSMASQPQTLELVEGKNYFRTTPSSSKGELIYGEEAFTGDARPVTILNANLPGNKVLVKTVMDFNRTVNRSYVAVTNGCMKGICVNDEVVTGRLSKAKVLAHFENGNFVTRDSRETIIWSSNDLARLEGCTTKFCRGDHTLTSKGKEFIIDGFFGNGDYLVRDAKKGHLSIAKGNSLNLTFANCRNIPIRRPGICHNH